LTLPELQPHHSCDLQPSLHVDGLSVSYGSQKIVNSVSFRLQAGQTLMVLGESGCGKTTLLRAVAGLVPIAAGQVCLNGRSITHMDPRDRGVIYLDQEPLMFEHLTVAENIGFAMRLKRVPEHVIQTSVEQMLDAVDLTEHSKKREWQLSGGQKQRVAFGRAILAAPRLLLLDEPFCSLDAGTRTQMQALFAEISRRYSLTSVFVTHDAKEALVAGHQFARMSDGGLHVYADRKALICDKSTGIPDEIAFWRREAASHAE
jgi:heme ABC exporter ATP-binding subunit CcmA